MTQTDFGKIMAYIGIAVGKPLSAEALAVYFDLLGDLSYQTLQLAAKRVVLNHRWATFPSIAELRESAAAISVGDAEPLTAADAWEIAWRAVGRIDPEQEGCAARELASVPILVADCIRAMGLLALCYGEEPVAVIRGQFLKTFEQIAGSRRRLALLPSALREQIEERKSLAGTQAEKLLSGIGQSLPEGEH